MQIVIDIPEGMLDELHTCKFPIHDAYRLCKIIEDGTPLPKGHGRLIDGDILKNQNCCSESYVKLFTIVEADKEGAEE